MPSRSVRFSNESPKLSISFDFCPPFIDYCDEAYELIQSNLNAKFNLIFIFFLLTILKFQLKKVVKGDLSGPLIDKGYKRFELIGESGEAYVYKVEDLNELKDSSFRMYDICTKKKWMYTQIESGEILWALSNLIIFKMDLYGLYLVCYPICHLLFVVLL